MNLDPETGKPIENAQPQIPVQPKKSNGVAIAGFVLALIGGFLLDIVGLILSIVGLNKSKECNSGKGLAIAGIIIAMLFLQHLELLLHMKNIVQILQQFVLK